MPIVPWSLPGIGLLKDSNPQFFIQWNSFFQPMMGFKINSVIMFLCKHQRPAKEQSPKPLPTKLRVEI